MTRLTLLFFALVWGSQTVRAENLIVFGDDSYPPVVYSKDGEITGFLPSILANLEAVTGDHYDIRLFPWKRAYELAYRGEGGVIGLSYT